jgi:hypothetical protein
MKLPRSSLLIRGELWWTYLASPLSYKERQPGSKGVWKQKGERVRKVKKTEHRTLQRGDLDWYNNVGD